MTTTDTVIEAYRYCREAGMNPWQALQLAKQGGDLPYIEAMRRSHRKLRRCQRRTVRLNALGVELLEALANERGVSASQYLEALMHYAISCAERPGSWEAQGFDFANYDPRRGPLAADHWF